MWSMILSDKVVGIKKRYMKNVAAPDTQIVDLLQLKQYYAVIVPFKVKTYYKTFFTTGEESQETLQFVINRTTKVLLMRYPLCPLQTSTFCNLRFSSALGQEDGTWSF